MDYFTIVIDYLKKKAQKKQKKYGKTKSVVRIAVYRRVSTIAQAEEGQSLEVQKTRINDYINFDKQFENKLNDENEKKENI